MKTTLLILLLASAHLARAGVTQSNIYQTCGLDSVKFAVKIDHSAAPIPQRDAANALVYFFQDDVGVHLIPKPEFRLGLDGNWVGATKSASYFYFTARPGEHLLCAKEQMPTISMGAALRPFSAHTRFVAEAGKTYYFRVSETPIRGPEIGQWSIKLEAVENDAAQTLMHRLAFSSSQERQKRN